MRDVLQDPFVKEAFSPAQKREIRRTQGHMCQMCGAKENPKKRKFEVHHAQPLSKGGLDEIDNGKLLCKEDHIIANRMFIQYGITFNNLLQFLNGKTTT